MPQHIKNSLRYWSSLVILSNREWVQAITGKAVELMPNPVCLQKQCEGSALPDNLYCKMPGTESLREFMTLNYRVCSMKNGRG